ncbi:GNAT family N-acetyltransferase [Facklamia sp. 7083-14-GEN3]|uniref:GNAT family N-acetyltransferase n=1 Tax=Facklamia sp. 7083-14-GEN3 TaxID=2973478 RepID=UPI00215C7C7E|nr:GNAT family N-acetyltransferase [Facklamia sp. 7083-14-GEN3]MCR8969362.1 GNAT family N-acetyltransferase [Facklamia sp. 7083-14-GEN3]
MGIHYHSKQNLTNKELQAAKALLKYKHQVDRTFSDPYLFNRYNFDQSMPSFYMAHKDGKMIGLLAVYADDAEVEVSIVVDPDYRRKNVASKLYENFQSETASYGIKSVTFKTERVFLEKHPQLLNSRNLLVADEEVLMAYGQSPYSVEERFDIKVLIASEDHVEAIARFQSESFEDDYDLTLRYARETVENQDSPIYIALHQGKVVASISADQSSEVNYLFGIAVDPNFQGQGIASYLMKQTINDLIKLNNKPFHLTVELNNQPAFNLYKKLGFSEITRIVYLKFKN